VASVTATRVAEMQDPQRIVSIVPSDTYTLFRLGVGDRLLGRTEYCVAPAEAAAVPTVGGTKNVDVAAVIALAPDLVVANQEENRKKDIDELRAAGIEVLLSFPKTVEEGLVHTRRLAALFPDVDAHAVLDGAMARHGRLSQSQIAPVPTFVPIWMDPLMTVNHDTFISDAVELCGGRNVFSDRERRYPLSADLGQRRPVDPKDRDTRYPRITLEEVVDRQPRLVILPDEPHEFTEADADVFRERLPSAEVRFCDGKDLMWYGLRSLEGLDRIAGLISHVYKSRS
jgi:ABC-type Fe3+-hydroxamate transport system substrate-binding protein